jgi:hypothetical protein
MLMVVSAKSPQLERDLLGQIEARTGRRVRNLAVELHSECVVLRGSASSYYVKQMAQQAIRDQLPSVPLENAITVVPTT